MVAAPHTRFPAHLNLEVLRRERVRDCDGSLEVRADHGEALRAVGEANTRVRMCRPAAAAAAGSTHAYLGDADGRDCPRRQRV